MKSKSVLIFIFAGIMAMTVFAHKNHMHSKVEFRPVTAEELERFHGHMGPLVVLGAFMGEHAVTRHDMPRYFGVTVEVECPEGPPPTCLIDGLQMTTGATMGKRNIRHKTARDFKITISNDDTGDSVIYTFKDSTKALLKRWEDEGVDVEVRGERTFKMKAEKLFDIEVIKAEK